MKRFVQAVFFIGTVLVFAAGITSAQTMGPGGQGGYQPPAGQGPFHEENSLSWTPVDGEVVEGESAVNEAMLTGESKPVSKSVGSKLIGGALNGEGSLTAEVQKTGKDSFLSGG